MNFFYDICLFRAFFSSSYLCLGRNGSFGEGITYRKKCILATRKVCFAKKVDKNISAEFDFVDGRKRLFHRRFPKEQITEWCILISLDKLIITTLFEKNCNNGKGE